MRRREYLLGGAGLAAVLAGGAYVTMGGDGGTGTTVSPVQIDTIEAPGSPGDTITVPDSDGVTVVEIFEPYCQGCHDQFPALAAVHETMGDGVQFVSLVPASSGFGPETIVEEWRKLGGAWPVGIDPDDHFFYETFHANSVPHLAVIDAAGTLRYSKSAVVSAETIRSAVREARGE